MSYDLVYYTDAFKMSVNPYGTIYSYVSNTPTKKFNKNSEQDVDEKLKRILDGL